MSEQPDQSTENIQFVEITQEPVELYKILKFEGLAASGAEAKQLVADGHVLVNGQQEFRRRRKILNHDLIKFDGHTLKICLSNG